MSALLVLIAAPSALVTAETVDCTYDLVQEMFQPGNHTKTAALYGVCTTHQVHDVRKHVNPVQPRQ